MRKLLLAAAAVAAAAFLAVYIPPLPWEAKAQVVPTGAVAVANSSTDVAAATATATLPAFAGRVTYLCGFAVTGLGATAGVRATLTISNLAAGTLTFDIGVPAGATVPLLPHVATFNPCLPGSAPNQTVTAVVGSFGTGNTNAQVNAWGFQQ